MLDFEDSEPWQTMDLGSATLHLSIANSLDSPAIGLTALSGDSPRKPTWNWDEFQLLQEDERAERFGAYYDQKYLSLDISHSSLCPLLTERFDHREDAQEAAYGQWLHGVTVDDVWHSSKGAVVSAPVSSCEQRTSDSPGAIEELIVTIDQGPMLDPLVATVRFRVYLIDKSLHWTF